MKKRLHIRELTAELVSKTLGSEGRAVRLKPALSSVCHPDLTQGVLFVAGAFLRLSQLLGMIPRRVAAGDREPVVVVVVKAHEKHLSSHRWLFRFLPLLADKRRDCRAAAATGVNLSLLRLFAGTFPLATSFLPASLSPFMTSLFFSTLL